MPDDLSYKEGHDDIQNHNAAHQQTGRDATSKHDRRELIDQLGLCFLDRRMNRKPLNHYTVQGYRAKADKI